MTRRVKVNFNEKFQKEFTVKLQVVLYIPLLAKLSESATAGLFMSQLLYWWGKGEFEGYVYKTSDEFQNETGLTRSQQDTAIKKWKKLEVLDVKLHGVPPIRYFKLAYQKLVDLSTIKLLQIQNQFAENKKLNKENIQNISKDYVQETTKDDIFNIPEDKFFKENGPKKILKTFKEKNPKAFNKLYGKKYI